MTCSFPERLSSKRWADLKERDLACTPQIIIPEIEVPTEIDENATLSCGARGDPIPSVNWVWAGRIVNHGSIFSSKSNTEPDAKLLLKAKVIDNISWLNLTVVQLKVGFLMNIPDQMIVFKCIIENSAQIIEKNVTLYVRNTSSSGVLSLEVMYIIMACIFVIILIAVLCLLITICFKRKRNRRKNYTSTSNEKNFLEKNNILIVNPVEKPPRHYEGDDSMDDSQVEMVNLLAGKSMDITEEEIDHLELNGRIRAPLTALQEEAFDSDSQELTSYSESVFDNKGLSDQYPDLLGNLKFARTLSPAQFSHHSLNRSMYNNHIPWRHSVMYSSDIKPNLKRFSHLPQPAFCQRSGYVTLPRRPRTSSAASSSSFVSHSQYSDNIEPLYDTLGPRTTANGTSNLNLADAPLCPTPVKLFPNQKVKEVVNNSYFSPIVQYSPQHCTLPRLSRKLSGSDSFYFSNRDNFKYKRTSPSHFRTIVCANKEVSTNPSTTNITDSSIDDASVKEHQTEDSSSTSCFFPLREELSDRSELLPSKSPPPKPLAKPCNAQIPSSVLSALASSNASSSGTSPRSYQDEGPDGTEV